MIETLADNGIGKHQYKRLVSFTFKGAADFNWISYW